MRMRTADVVICGAGIAGISVAYQLAITQQIRNIMLVDPLPPMTMTSDKSTECYRNWWPGPDDAMVRLMNRSIDLLEQLHQEAPDRLHMNRRGYLYATADHKSVDGLIADAREISELGAGPLRIHRGPAGDQAYTRFRDHAIFDAPEGADILLGGDLIQRHFPFLTERTVAVLHTRRCGWFAAQQFGMYMLEKGRELGVQLVNGRVSDVVVNGNQVEAVRIDGREGTQMVSTPLFVNAAGPFQATVGQLMDIDIPVFNERHVKMVFSDHQRVIPRDMPLLIWMDPVYLSWSDEEKALLAESDETCALLAEMPAGLHGRAEGDSCLLNWGYHAQPVEPVFPIPMDQQFPEITLRGMATVIPGLAGYLDRIPRAFLDGGYYTRTRENRPLIGPLPVDGAFLLGGLGGFGLQVSCGASELLANHITGNQLPDYASAFLLSRYQDPAYRKLLDNWGASGQL